MGRCAHGPSRERIRAPETGSPSPRTWATPTPSIARSRPSRRHMPTRTSWTTPRSSPPSKPTRSRRPSGSDQPQKRRHKKEAAMPKQFTGTVNIDIKDSVPDWGPFTQPTAPEGAPNILYVVLDDVGFSAMEPFGGLIQTPNIKRIVDAGITYTSFHTTAL